MIFYVGGAFGGKAENKQLIEDKIREIIKNNWEIRAHKGDLVYEKYVLPQNATLFSPVHSFSFLYDETSYLQGIEYCLSILDKCDGLILLNNWENSRGANIEYGFAKGNNIPIFILE